MITGTLGTSWTNIASGSYTNNGATLTYYIDAKLDSQSVANNNSSISTRARTVMSGYYMQTYHHYFSCTGCKTVEGNNSTIYSFETKTVLTGSITINHNANGTGTLSMSGKCSGNLGMNINVSDSIALPTINRYSTITTLNDFTIENGVNISYTDYLSNYDLTLTCAIGSNVIFESTMKSAAGSHTFSAAFDGETRTRVLASISSHATSETFTFTLATSGITGSSTKTAVGTLSEPVNNPQFRSAVMAETNQALTRYNINSDTVVKYLSKKQISVEVDARSRASISSVKVKNGSSGTEYTMTLSNGLYSATISNPTSKSFIITATDSRGFKATYTLDGTLVNYSRPTITKIDFGRTTEISADGYVRPSGTYWAGTIGTKTNEITWVYNVGGSTSREPISATYRSTSWSGDASLSNVLLRENAYTCTVTATDAFGQSVSSEASIGIAKLSAWFGKETVKAEGFVGVHWIGLYKVGDIFLTLNTENPANRFGGTWELISQGRFLLGSDSTLDEDGVIDIRSGDYKAGDTGGEATHTLTINEMPAHVHHVGYGGNVYGSDYGAIGSNPSGSGSSSSNATDHTGGNSAHNNMPPYLVCYIWKKTS